MSSGVARENGVGRETRWYFYDPVSTSRLHHILHGDAALGCMCTCEKNTVVVLTDSETRISLY